MQMTIMIYNDVFYGPFDTRSEAVEIAESWGWDTDKCILRQVHKLEKMED
jgi:hypothetical protein